MLRLRASPALAISIVAALSLSACERAAPPAAVEPAPPPEPAAAPPTPEPPPVVDRDHLITAISSAASAFAATGGTGGGDLAGRRFLVRQAFGCFGPSPAGADIPAGFAGWRWGPEGRAIEIQFKAADWTRELPSTESPWEAIDGLWLARPWLRTEDCPRPGPPALAATAASPDVAVQPTPQSMGLAAVYPADGTRVGRRADRTYSFRVRGKDKAPPAEPARGYRLVLEGRIVDFDGGGAIRCHGPNPDQRPVCLVAAELDRIAFEDADGATLSEWRPG